MRRLFLVLIWAMLAGCGDSAIAGEYRGQKCPDKQTFNGKNTVYVQIHSKRA